ncbi:ATP-binding protein [Aestuariivirga sp.]|uniref:ATP-binding protein n=1 Tax=Aestuariivirga sp. TaxID=2650926 RepID=UPI0039E4CB57
MLIERDGPLAALAAAASAARAGTGQSIIVSGEAGAGKTALIDAFAKSDPAMKVFRGGSEALFTPRPLGPLRDMGVGFDRHVAELLDRIAPPEVIFPAVLKALQDSARLPVLVFEDAHWADDATLDLIKYLGRRIAYMRALMIVSFRSEEIGPDHPLMQVLGDLPSESAKRIALEPLSANGLAGLTQTSPEEARELHRITAGNPFFATELVASGALAARKAPASVRDAVWARLQRLSPAERGLLEAISIEPVGSESWLADALLDRNCDAVLESCADRGLLIRDEEGRFCFRHEIARAATLDRLRPSAQKMLHRRAYDALNARAAIPLSRLVHHASGADMGEKVLELAARAAQEAIRLGAHREAARYLGAALAHAKNAPPGIAAQLHEDWSVEASLSLKIGEEIIAAAMEAVRLWREAGRPEKVANMLRWLSRLHWLRGDSPAAVRFIEEALQAFEGVPPTRELAMIYSTRAQLYMFNDRFEEAGHWSRKAIALSEALGDQETRVHALNNLGGSMLFAGDGAGKPFMQESLDLALAHGFHDHASRAYTNFIEYAILAKEFALAERLLGAALAFASQHDLDGALHILSGRQAQLKLEQGKFREAEAIASAVVTRITLAFIAKLPAQMVLARAKMRLGHDGAAELLEQLMQDAVAIGEQQHIVPARLALIESAWLRGDEQEAQRQLGLFSQLHLEGIDGWDLGAFGAWWSRCRMAVPFPAAAERMAPPRLAEFEKRFEEAFAAWQALGLPYEAALSLLGEPSRLPQAIAMLDEMGAAAAAATARRMARAQGLPVSPVKVARGPYGKARQHPLGLTGRQADVFRLLAEGLSNQDIASRLACSPRTVENHVTAILGKLNSSSRMDVMLRLRNEPWLLA